MKSITNPNKYPNNIRFLNNIGELIFLSNYSKVKFYLRKNLGQWVSQNPPIFQLNFETKGDGNKGSDYYLNDQYTRCVVCGTNKDLHKTHIVPKFVRKHYNQDQRSSHDVLLICEQHYVIWNKIQNNKIKKAEIIVPSDQITSSYQKNCVKIWKYLRIKNIPHIWLQIPEKRRATIINEICEFFQLPLSNIGESQMRNLKNFLPKKPKVSYNFHNLYFETWALYFREAFVDSLNPKFLPKNWKINFQEDK